MSTTWTTRTKPTTSFTNRTKPTTSWFTRMFSLLLEDGGILLLEDGNEILGGGIAETTWTGRTKP